MSSEDHIQPYGENPRYWQYKGKPVLLLGGSVEDNLFQIADLEEHLRLLRSVGGNYVRCTMSSRDEGDVWPFEKDGDLYDLEKPSQEYWARFERFLELAAALDIIAQFELWDRFDYARGPWQANPFNPKNNCNYTVEESGLQPEIDTHPGKNESRFFFTVPDEDNNELVLGYQKALVDEMLSRTLGRPNLLYCMDNETSAVEGWGRFWSEYIKAHAAEQGVCVHTTEMWDSHDLSHEHHKRTFDHPETYSFCDISQNNHNRGDVHWENQALVRGPLDPIRPLNYVKIYGSDEPHDASSPNARLGVGGLYGQTRDGLERFWRGVFGGLAAVRFHRPPAGLGLAPVAQAHIRSMRMLTDAMDVFSCEPHNDLLSYRKENGAFAFANPGAEYAVFFPHGEAVNIDLECDGGPLTARWLDVEKSEWAREQKLEPGRKRALIPPGERYWAVLIQG